MLDFLAFPSGWLLKVYYYKLSNSYLRRLGLDVLRISECLDLEMFLLNSLLCVSLLFYFVSFGGRGCGYCVLLAL